MELLEKARRDYPIGTKFKSMKFNSMKDVAEHIVTKPIFIQCGNIYTTNDDFKWITIYDKSDNQWAEIIKEEPTLLEKARRDYPIGTKIKSLFNSTSHIITKTVFDHYWNIYTVDDNLNFICVYHKACNNWAEIIKEEITPLKLLNSKAECIFHISKNGDVILRGKVIANDIELSEMLTIINTNNMTQQEFNSLRVGQFISQYEILHKYKEFLIVRCDDGHDLFDLNKINKLGLKITPKTFMGLEVKKYDYVPCEVNDSALVYLCYIKEDGILFSNCKNGNIDNLKPTSIRIL